MFQCAKSNLRHSMGQEVTISTKTHLLSSDVHESAVTAPSHGTQYESERQYQPSKNTQPTFILME